jgi:fatty acid desaturase
MQIEHHLFPGVNHCHLHIIQPVVRTTCKEHGIFYKCYDTWGEVFDANLKWVTRLANEPEFDHKKMD